MSATRVHSLPNLTFVSTTGPTLDNISTKAMRAHTTKANFARRRQRLVREYAAQKEAAAHAESLQIEEDGQNPTKVDQILDIQLPIISHQRLDRDLNSREAFFINHLTQAMGKLHLVTNIPELDTTLAVMRSDWVRFLPDPAMLDVSLYWAGHVYIARRQRDEVQLVVDEYKGRAIRSVRERLNDVSNGLSDSLIAAILILTILDQVLGNLEAWKIHVSGLLQIITIRSRNSKDRPAQWVFDLIPRTTLQGLLLFMRHDPTLLTMIERTAIFDTMFSAPAKKAAYLILAAAEQVVALQNTYIRDKTLLARERERLRLICIIKSLDTAVELTSTAYPVEAYLTAMALSLKLFLETVLRHDTGEDFEDTAVQLIQVLQKPGQQLCSDSALALCLSLETVFWQTMMGAIAAPDARTKSYYISRLRRVTIALALTSWHDAEVILQRFFWISDIFSALGYQILSEIVPF